MMTEATKFEQLPFEDLWEPFLAWRVAILEWGLSPQQVFDELDPPDPDYEFQFVTDERIRAMERLLIKPDPDLRLAFTQPYRSPIAGSREESEVQWDFYLRPWLEAFLAYAVATVPPNYRRKQLMLIPYAGLEPLKGCPPPASQRLQ
jgi:hypothetical protein